MSDEMKPKYRRVHPRKQAIQRAIDIQKFRAESRRKLYGMLRLKHDGIVPCFVCGEHVDIRVATLEHVVPLSKGGKDKMTNYAISHPQCNTWKGDMLLGHLASSTSLPDMKGA